MRKSGERFPVIVSPAVIRDERGDVSLVFATVKDITERKRTEEALRASEERYRLLVENAADAIYVHELSPEGPGRFLEVNDRACQMLGYSREELLAIEVPSIDVPEQRERVPAIIAQLFAKGHAQFETEHLAKDGRRIPVEINTRLFDLHGTPTVLSIIRDVTERKLAENTLRESEESLGSLFEAMPSGGAIYEVRNDGAKGSDYIVKAFNAKSLEIEGKTREMVVGKSLFDLRPRIDEYGLIPVFQKVWRTGEPEVFPSTLYVDEHFSSYYENRVFKLPSGEIVAIYDDVTERVQAEQELRESRERFALAAEGANDGIWDWDLISGESYMSRRWKSMLGYADDELAEQYSTWESLLHPDDHDLVHGAFQAAREGTVGEVEIEYRMRHKDGSYRWILDRGKTLRDEQGRPYRMAGSHTDITERKQAEVALRQSEAQLRTLLDTLPDLVWLKDPDGVYLSCNRRFECLFGAAEKDIVGKTDYDFTDRDLADFFRERDKAAAAAGGPTANEEELVFAEDGHREVLETIKTPILASDGRLIGVLGVGRDITARKRAEEAMRNSEATLRSVLDATPFPVALVDAGDDVIDFWSRSALTLFGHTAPTAAEWYQIAYPDPDYRRAVTDRWKPHLEKARLSGQAVNTGKYRVTCRDGSVRMCELYATFLADRLVVTFNDITKRELAEEELRAANETLGMAQRAAGAGLWDWNMLTGKLTWSPEFLALFGLPADAEASFETWRSVLHPEDLEAAEACINEAVAQHIPLENEYRIVRPGGEAIWIGALGDASYDEAGTPLRMSGICFDITDRKRSQEAVAAGARHLRTMLHDTVRAMGAIVELRDPYTGDHERRAARLADAIAAEMGVNDWHREGLRLAGEVHDIGKIGVPAEILSKPGLLSEVELSLVRQHAVIGRGILSTVTFDWPVAEIVGQHHERLDGSGYPDGLKGDEMLPEARILAVADVVEAMASHRPYRPALGIDAALDEVRGGAGTRYDADAVAACERVFAAGFVFAAPDEEAAP